MTTQTIEIPVKGMDCASCVKHVQEAIEGLPGVSSANVLLSSEKAIVELDPKRVDIPAIAKTVGIALGGVGGHTPADVPQQVDLAAVELAGRLLLATIGQLAF